MDENEWLASTDPAAMLDFVTRRPQQPAATNRRRISDRKLRLFACACCRQVWHLLADPRSREAVKVSEKYADDTHPSYEWGPAHNAAVAARARLEVGNYGFDYLHAAWMAEHTVLVVPNIAEVMRHHTLILGGRVTAPRVQANLLRDIVGNPFRPVKLWNVILDGVKKGQSLGSSLDDYWLTPTVLSIAQAAYDERAPDGTLQGERLLVLSDALEDAGCPTHVECSTCVERPGFRRMYPRDQLPGSPPVYGTCWDCGDRVSWNAFKEGYRRGDPSSKGSGKRPNPILAHLRSPGPHYRGMWSLDLLLGKE